MLSGPRLAISSGNPGVWTGNWRPIPAGTVTGMLWGRKGLHADFHSEIELTRSVLFPILLRLSCGPSGLVVKGKSSRPRNKEGRNGDEKSGRNGAPAPQSRESLSAVKMQFTPRGEAS